MKSILEVADAVVYRIAELFLELDKKKSRRLPKQ